MGELSGTTRVPKDEMKSLIPTPEVKTPKEEALVHKEDVVATIEG